MSEHETSDHSKMVSDLAKPGTTIAVELTGPQAHLWHMATGIAGECGELLEAVINEDSDNALEEFGDIEFYLTGLCQGLDIELIQALDPSLVSARYDGMTDVVIAGAEVLDQAKRVAIYQDASKLETLGDAAQALRDALDILYLGMSFNREEALQANIAKLGDRYNNFVYSDESAVARADKAGEE